MEFICCSIATLTNTLLKTSHSKKKKEIEMVPEIHLQWGNISALVGKVWAKTVGLGQSFKEWMEVEASQPPQFCDNFMIMLLCWGFN